jgi:hypothetical protein
MALRALAASIWIACVVIAAPAQAQTATVEVAAITGVSTDELSADAVQLRAFGDVRGGIRYFGELSWGWSSDVDNDAFAAAYPYGNRVDVMEAYAEGIFHPHDALFAARGGRFRTPFGIYNASDQAYTGFLRPPLIRYHEYSGISNHFLEQGGDVTVGVPWLTVETAVGAPADVGHEVRKPGVDSVTRVQAYYGPLIAGFSYISSTPIDLGEAHTGRSDFTGVDLRWSRRGLQLRAEWITGRPYDGASTTGWYGDAILHVVGMGPVTAVGRLERIAFDEPSESEAETSYRQTIGARVRLPLGFAANVNFVHRSGDLDGYKPTSLDVGLLWSGRRSPM